MEYILSFTFTVMAGVVAGIILHYIIKWLDSKK